MSMQETMETQFARLDERLKALDKKQDEHYNSILVEIKDLKDGTSAKIADHESRLQKLERSNSKYFLVISLYSMAILGMIALIVNHILQK